ncbi:hypothetical protein ES705_40583 [subsurface metagenome]
MNKYPIVSGKRLIKALKKAGYVIHKGRRGKGGKGSHIVMKHPTDNRKIAVVPDTSKDLAKGLLGTIKRQLKMSRKEFINLLQGS